MDIYHLILALISLWLGALAYFIKDYANRTEKANKELIAAKITELQKIKSRGPIATCNVVKYDIQPINISFWWEFDPRRRWVNINQMGEQELLLGERVAREELANAIGAKIKDYFIEAVMSGDHPAIEIIETPSKTLRLRNDPYTVEVVVKVMPKMKI